MKINWINKRDCPARSVAVGTFDGVHRGHQELIKRALALSSPEVCGTVFTFDSPPRQYFQDNVRLVTSFAQRVRLIQDLGIDQIAWLTFNKKLASLSPETFVAEILVNKLRAKQVVCGFDFRFGRNQEGDPALLKELGPQSGFEVTVVPAVTFGSGRPISSTVIRGLIDGGQIEAAAQLLGYFPSYCGKVVRGAGRGRRLGFPTANLDLDPQVILPRDGVYLTWCILADNTGLPGLTSVGRNPTFAGRRQTVEAYIFDFSGNLYGQKIEVQFLERIRDVEAYPSAGLLQEQISSDLQAAEALLPRFRLQGSRIVLE